MDYSILLYESVMNMTVPYFLGIMYNGSDNYGLVTRLLNPPSSSNIDKPLFTVDIEAWWILQYFTRKSVASGFSLILIYSPVHLSTVTLITDLYFIRTSYRF